MVYRVQITPKEVRGYGNIVIPKLSTDFLGKYNEIYTSPSGNFILSYGGVMLKMSATVQNTIKDMVATLNVAVTSREGNSPIPSLVVGCDISGTTLPSQTTNNDGECSFTWTPTNLGSKTITLTIAQQGAYAGLTQTKEITIGVLLSFNSIFSDLWCEDDEVYIADVEQQVQSRTQLVEFVKDVWVAEGGEPIVDEYGIIHLATAGDVIVEQDSLEQLSEYHNVLFDYEVDSLVGGVCDVELTEDYDLVVTCLERDDII